MWSKCNGLTEVFTLHGLNLALVNHNTVERFASITVLSRRSINRIFGVLVTLEHCSLDRWFTSAWKSGKLKMKSLQTVLQSWSPRVPLLNRPVSYHRQLHTEWRLSFLSTDQRWPFCNIFTRFSLLKVTQEGWGCQTTVKCLPSMTEALISIHGTERKSNADSQVYSPASSMYPHLASYLHTSVWGLQPLSISLLLQKEVCRKSSELNLGG